MRLPARLGWTACLVCLVGAQAGPAHADAVIRSKAASASTIAQYFVDEERVLVELEIGLSDIPAFKNLLPDEIYEKLGEDPEPSAARLERFFAEDFLVSPPDGKPLRGRLLELAPAERLRRDEITGAPLPTSEEPADRVISARLEFRLGKRPARLTIGGRAPLAGASIGFVLYHRDIAVNDFRYLSSTQTVKLDWIDPWYSEFEMRALRRAYFAPMSGFIYVENFEVRKEIILRPKDLQSWVDLGLEGRETIPVELQDGLKLTVAEFLRDRQPVRIDGEDVEAELAQINFLERTLTSSRVIDPPVELDLNAAILGAIFVYPIESLPQRVTMEWDLFNERIQRIPASAVDQAGPLPSYLEPDFAMLEWQNFLKNPQVPTLMELVAPPPPWQRAIVSARWPAVAVVLLAAGWFVASARRRTGVTPAALVLVVALTVIGAAFWSARENDVSGDRTNQVVAGLLHNVYRAFDFRDEGQIYDVLAQSVDGDLLTRIYLETRRGLELANQGGARAKVEEVDLVELEAVRGDAGGVLARATWTVGGSVGHWGHVHTRRNQYRADLDIRPVDGAWKIVGIEILEEQRL